MSQPPENDVIKEPVTVTVNVKLYTYAPPAKGSKAKPRKESKNKEFDHRFEKGKSAYMKLIEEILSAFKITHLKIGEKPCLLKICAPGVRAEARAISLEDATEYDMFVDRINEVAYPPNNVVRSVSAISAFIDMRDLEKKLKKVRKNSTNTSDDSDADSEDEGDMDKEDAKADAVISKSEALRAKYLNPHDAGCTFIDSKGGKAFVLTPQMLKDWATEINDDWATLYRPSDTLLQSWYKKSQPVLDPDRAEAEQQEATAQLTAQPPTVARQPAQSEALQTLTLLGGLAGRLGFAGTAQVVLPPTPVTPVKPKLAPPINTPSKLRRFLDYCTDHGIPQALDYENGLAIDHVGPDILPKVPDEKLVGIPFGDKIRLKELAEQWWASPDAQGDTQAKRARAETNPDAGWSRSGRPRLGSLQGDPDKNVAYHITWADKEGSCRTYGPMLARADPFDDWNAGDPTRIVKYRNEATGEFELIPDGFKPVFAGEAGTPNDDVY
ncbi:hypothetical protein GGG16DRAFT_112350 [Schizophyllum commune]